MTASADPAVAIRQSVAVTRLDHIRAVRLRGPDARSTLDRLCAGALRLRDGQVQHVLLLDQDARCFADAYALCDDEDYELLADGPDQPVLREHIARHLPPGGDVEIEDRNASHVVLGIDGPFAWELLSRLAGAEVVGLPYLTFFHAEEWTCARAGRTGEYGYLLSVPRAHAEEVLARALGAGEPLDVARGTVEALDQCALENFFFNVRREGREPVTPIELQLQWRVDYGKGAVGLEALRRHRAAGVRFRLTCIVAETAVSAGDVVRRDAAPVGRVVNAGWSAARGDCVALALLEPDWAHSGIRGFAVEHGGASVAARSVSPPTLNNRSLFVSPQLHSYETRSGIEFPPLARP
jgi:aminomethyltransferase